MKFRPGYIIVSFLLLVSLLLSACSPSIRPTPPSPSHTTTTWQVRTSVALEALAFLNALTGDPLVAPSYTAAVDHFSTQFSPVTQQALKNLAALRDKTGSKLQGILFKPFVAAHAETIDDMLALIADPERMREALLQYDHSGVEYNQYYSAASWKTFVQALPDLETALRALQGTGFEQYWEDNFKPALDAQAAHLQEYLAQYNIIPTIEQYLGFSLSDDTVTVYLAYFFKPYGNHVIDNTFVTEPGVPDEHLVRTAIHELLHDPYNYADSSFRKATDTLEQDPLFKQHMEQSNPDYAYNTWYPYLAENCVRALEQLISEQVGVAQDIHTRWGQGEDEGMFSMAAVLYSIMKQENFATSGESFQSFLARMVQEGRLTPEKTQALYDTFFQVQGNQ